MHSIRILGTRIDDVTFEDVLSSVDSYLCESGLRQIATVNPEFVMLARTNSDFSRVLDQCAINVPDGVGILWAARHLKNPLRERIPGQELVERICQLAAQRGKRIFLLGAREGIAERAAIVLQHHHPGLEISGCCAGSPSPEQDEQIAEQINRSGTSVLFVAYGPPKQELWIARNNVRLKNVKVAMGVGGTFDTLAGRSPRAPRWIRDAGFEWAYRLVREPRRLRRQLTIPHFMWLVVTQGSK